MKTLYLLLFLLVVFTDYASKYYIKTTMIEGMSIPVINGLFHITYVLNTGAAFGLFAGQRALFIAVGSLLFIVTAVYYRYIVRQGIFFQVGVALFLGGALGNLIDRIRFGQVVDFLDFRIWPVFNIADIAICLGAGFILLFVLRSELQE